MAVMRLLLVEDDDGIAGPLVTGLEREGFDVTRVANGQDALSAAEPDLVLLDLRLPDIDGYAVARGLRERSRVPIIMVSAKGEEIDRILGLELGADDYVPKPCTPRELVARIRAILRRTQSREPASPSSGPLTVGLLTMWPEKRGAEWSGEPLELTSTEFNLLEVLIRNAGRVVSKQELSEQGLGRPLARYDRGIDVHLSSIRHKLGGGEGRSPIQTVRGIGYQYVKE